MPTKTRAYDIFLETNRSRFDERFVVDQVIRDRPNRFLASGRDTTTGEEVVLHSATDLSRGAVIGMECEVAALDGMRSEFLFRTVEAAFQKHSAVIVDQYVEGQGLRESMGGGACSPRTAIEVGKSLFQALRELHQAGIHHLDVRPEKVILAAHGAVLLRNNIAAAQLSDESSNDRIRRISYMSPEQAGSIERDVAAPADLYSAGAVLYYMLAARAPFVANDVGGVLLAHMTAPVQGFQELGVAVPRALELVVQRLLSKDPSDRYQTAEAVLYDLDQIGQELDRGNADPQFAIGSNDDRSTLIEPSFVGRTAELGEILDQMEDASQGGARLVLLEGISGSGKSRLLVEVAQQGVGKGFQLFRGRGVKDAARGFSLIEGTVKDLVTLAQSDQGARSDFFRSFDADLSCLACAFPEISQIADHDPQALQGPEDFAEARTLRALSSFFDSLGTADRPALIILDDCQWADSQTYKLLEMWVAENSSRDDRHVLLLLACRSEEVDAEHPLRQLPTTAHIELSDLSADDLQLLAESMAGTLPAQAIELIIDAANGSPFMASATVRGLVESGAIVRRDTGWVIDEKSFAECQSSNRAGEFLTRRLELLSQPTLELLTAAAVLGKEFDLDAVNFLTGHTAAVAMRWFDEARDRNMVWVRGNVRHGNFSHDKIREALLDRLDFDERKSIHQKAAEYLCSLDHPSAAQIAFHFDAAGKSDLALPYAAQAAEEAKNNSSLDMARDLYLIAERAVAANDAESVYRVSKGLGEVLMLQGEYGAAEERFKRGEQLASGTIGRAQILLKLSELARKRGNLESAIQYLESGLEVLGNPVPKRSWQFGVRLVWEIFVQLIATSFPNVFVGRYRRDPTESERLCMSLLSTATHAYWFARGKSETLWAHLHGLNLGERFRPSLELAHAYSEHAPVMSLLGMINRARNYAQKSFEIRESFGDLWGQGQSRCFHAVALYSGSLFEEAVARGRESVRLLERAGDYWYVHMARYQVAASLYRLGRFREAVEESEETYKSALAIGDEQNTGVMVEVWSQAADGNVPAEHLETELERDRIDMQTRCEVLMADGIRHLREGNLDLAIERMDEGIRVINEANISNAWTLPVYYWKTRTLRMKAEQTSDSLAGPQRIDTLRKAWWSGVRALLEGWMCKNDIPRVLRELALIRLMQGHSKQAAWLLAASLKRAERLKLHFDYAESLRVLAEVQESQGIREAEANAHRAKTLLAQITVAFGISDSEEEQASETLSLADRFDTILRVGRDITTALVERDVFEETRRAAIRLLRCEECVIVEKRNDEFVVIAGPPTELDFDGLSRCIQQGQAVAGRLDSVQETQDDGGGSLICSPIYLLGNITACIYATHSGVRDLFGATEERLANFISTICGASLENAKSYHRLQELNQTLEDRVAERTEAAEARARELAVSNEELERTACELRTTEEQLREAIKEANSANEAKSQFLATVSHEIRTPMNGILGMTELLARMGLSAQQKTCVNVVKQSGETLLTLINDILDLSKIEAGKMELEQIPFQVREVVEHSVRLMSAAAHQKGLEIVCEIDNSTPLSALGDPNRIRQIMTNLIGNAIKFTEQGEIHVSVNASHDQIAFAVRDTGIGIPADKLDVIFDAFRQSDSSTTRQYGGTGLGLSICRTLVELMGGKLGVRSQLGSGSTFEFGIPVAEAVQTQFDLGRDGWRGLVAAQVCSSPSATRARQQMLECLGLSVMSFASLAELGGDAGEFDLVLVDEPTLNQWMQEKLPVKNVIAVTRAESVIQKEVHQVTKPVVLDELVTAIEAVVGGDTSVPSSESVQPESAGSGYHILVADDSVVNQEVASGLLEFAGHRVKVANNGQEAVETFLSHDFDLILMDVEMPDVDGLEATRSIRERGSDIPIIALSAHELAEKKQACFDAGVDDYVAKPFEPDELLEKIEKLVNRSPSNVTV